MSQLVVIGYPAAYGGASTELWATLKLWAANGLRPLLLPTWGADPKWRAKTEELGLRTIDAKPDMLASVEALRGATCVSFCNGEFLKIVPALRELGCRLVWVNCMTYVFDKEREIVKSHGPFDAHVFQSDFQRSMIEPELTKLDSGYRPELAHMIRGAFDFQDWTFAPRPHADFEEFFLGRVARADRDKWSTSTYKVYGQVSYQHKRAILLGVTADTRQHLGSPPWWVDTLGPNAIDVPTFLSRLHCLLPINGGARENWPRAGLEAMAAGVPVVAQRQWGWCEMIEHGVTGFLGSSDEELAHWAAVLAWDEPLRLRIAQQARERLEAVLANPVTLWAGWQKALGI